jgi:hypothetical protein
MKSLLSAPSHRYGLAARVSGAMLVVFVAAGMSMRPDRADAASSAAGLRTAASHVVAADHGTGHATETAAPAAQSQSALAAASGTCGNMCEHCETPCEQCGTPCEQCETPCEQCETPCQQCETPCQQCETPCQQCETPCGTCVPCETTGGTTGGTTSGTTGGTTSGTTGGTTSGTTGGTTSGTTGGTTAGTTSGTTGATTAGTTGGTPEMPHTGTNVFFLVPVSAAFLIAGSLLLRRRNSHRV